MARLRTYLLAAVAALFTTAALAQSSSSPVTVLSAADAQQYRQIFFDEKNGNFSDAQARIAQLSDRSLVGYAEAQHYLSPYSSASVDQLVDWMNQYRDLPIADRIYRLAVEKATVTVKRHHRVVAVKLTTTVPTPAPPPRRRGGGYEDPDLPDQSLSSEAARAVVAQITAARRAGQPQQGDAAVQALAAANSVPSSDIARLDVLVAASYMAAGQDYEAFDVALRPASADRQAAPMLDWWAGLAAYRMGRFDVAASRFETVLQNGAIPSWIRGGAAFWAARAYMQSGNPVRVVTLLNYASAQQPTFYGLLAEKLLGEENRSVFRDPVADAASTAALMQDPAAHRAVALWQVGEGEYVHDEMTRALANLALSNGQTYAAVARQMSFADLELRASEMLAARGTYLTGLFPVPSYKPADGYRLDQSLLLAFTRTESKFQPAAVSPMGARGLMQLMPATAAQLAHGQPSQSQLCDPSFNMNLGQKYLEQLLAMAGGGVLQLAAAYNAGPGNVMRWMNGKDDPLMFIETMPAQETRAYVKRVITYYWMYNRIAGKSSKTLEDTARGYWPRYDAMYTEQMAPAAALQPASAPVIPAEQPVSAPVATLQAASGPLPQDMPEQAAAPDAMAPIHLVPPPDVAASRAQPRATARERPYGIQALAVRDVSAPH
ncbi:MAG: transglycosylase SLT domain-containing protein [Alphaproteobacteria bacterium]|nr:transglycosylase SLT domain-containing protein [Alphaproteobacteria bacterium]